MKRLFSGIQPTGDLHIGNYLGAIRQWVRMQREFECVVSIVDLHAITVRQDPQALRSKTREVAALLIASGIDTDRSALFVQSHVSAHSELAWILNCTTPMGWMKRMTQYKEKSASAKENVSVGLFDYPALMAADILLYLADAVPVGEDQQQHVELTRDIAKRFNQGYGETFRLPEPLVPDVGGRIMALGDPTRKMSKSDSSRDNAISLLDPPDVIRSKIRRAATDSGREIRFDEGRPGLYNLLVILELFSGSSRGDIEGRFEGVGYAQLKGQLAEVVIEGLRPLQARFSELMADPSHIDALLAEGSSKVRPLAESTLKLVHERVGLG